MRKISNRGTAPVRREIPSVSAEVRALLPAEIVNIAKWYRKEAKKPKNWPSSPERYYKNTGWVSWLDLFGK